MSPIEIILLVVLSIIIFAVIAWMFATRFGPSKNKKTKGIK